MARVGRGVLLLIMGVLLAGCFRQADTESQAVTLDTPPTNSGPTFTPFNPEPTNTAALLMTVAASNTPVADATDDQPFSVVVPTDTPSQMFITPESPFSTLLAVTASFTPDVNVTVTPGGLITPTDFLNPDVSGSAVCEYEVRSGDSLFRIAINNETTVEAIKALNGMTSDTIFPGDILKIPGCGEETTTGEATDVPVAGGATPMPDGWQLHTVQSGEVLGTIAERYGVSQSRIIEVNQLSDPDSLSVGQQLVIPSE